MGPSIDSDSLEESDCELDADWLDESLVESEDEALEERLVESEDDWLIDWELLLDWLSDDPSLLESDCELLDELEELAELDSELLDEESELEEELPLDDEPDESELDRGID